MNFVRSYCVFIGVILAFFIVSAEAQENPRPVFVEGSDNQWFVENAARAGDVRIADFLGRQSLQLKNNTHVIKSNLEFLDGTIEFDVAPTDKGHFIGILFRRESFQNHENIYLRAHKSGQYNALQYAPRINGGATWQIYPEFNTAIELPRNQWTHVRVEVRGTQVEFFLNNAEKPVLTVPRLRSNSAKGTVAFWARVNDEPDKWAAALSNISIRPANPVKTGINARPAPPAGTLAAWEVGGLVQTEKGAVTKTPEIKDWRSVETEESGLVNLNRAFGNLRGRWTAFARTTVKSSAAKTVLLELGYSDDVTVFLNGEPVYTGINGWESRYPEYMGFVQAEYERTFLKLQPGNNEITLAVSDDQRFGWGFIARIKE